MLDPAGNYVNVDNLSHDDRAITQRLQAALDRAGAKFLAGAKYAIGTVLHRKRQIAAGRTTDVRRPSRLQLA
jgi:hypothetical protein